MLQAGRAPASQLAALTARALPDGGFAPAAGGARSRPDSTAWAALALAVAAPRETGLLQGARSNLAELQREDGAICIESPQPLAFWPTALALMAWRGDAAFDAPSRRAADFLLRTDGIHFQKPATSPMGHDTSLRGWPWASRTHSWVEPTALSLLALNLEGDGRHERCLEATRMLLDRQLPSGGWNYGNTTVYGNQLRPLPCETGIALAALAGRAQPAGVAASLNYLESELAGIRTPLTLAWGILGLSAWKRRPSDSRSRLLESWNRQEAESPYSTTELSLLALAEAAPDGLSDALSQNRGSQPK